MDCKEFAASLDAYIDNELNALEIAELEAHAECCENCKSELKAAAFMKDALKEMAEEEVFVPLPAQAAWTSAVRTEAKQIKMRRIIKIAGSVAAAFVIAIGGFAFLRNNAMDKADSAMLKSGTAVMAFEAAEEQAVESDGVSQGTSVTADIEWVLKADSVKKACAVTEQLCGEYGAELMWENKSDDEAVCLITVPAENEPSLTAAMQSLGDLSETRMVEISGDSIEIHLEIRA